MKKFIVLFVLCIVVSAFGSVFAQQATGVMPEIDEELAAPLLGDWYFETMCHKNKCFPISAIGMSGTFSLNADNSAVLVISGEEEIPEEYWYYEDGTPYYLAYGSDGSYTPLELVLTDDGKLSITQGDGESIYTRNEIIEWGTGEVKEDAEADDYLGEWYLTSILFDGGSVAPTLVGMEGKIIFREDSFEYETNDASYENIPFEHKDGKIIASALDANGEEVSFTFEYHVEDAVVLIMEPAVFEESGLAFVQKENYQEVDHDALFSFITGLY